MKDRQAFIGALKNFRYIQAKLDDPELGEAEESVKAYAPNSDLSDILFYGECERSTEEMVDEALLRQKIWREGGRPAVREHIRANMKKALTRQDLQTCYRYSAMAILKGIECEEQNESGG